MAKIAEAASKMDGNARAGDYLSRIAALLEEMASEQGSYMARCKGIRDDIKEVYNDAKDAGVDVRALKLHVQLIKLQDRSNKKISQLDALEKKALVTQVRAANTKLQLELFDGEPIDVSVKVATTEARVN